MPDTSPAETYAAFKAKQVAERKKLAARVAAIKESLKYYSGMSYMSDAQRKDRDSLKAEMADSLDKLELLDSDLATDPTPPVFGDSAVPLPPASPMPDVAPLTKSPAELDAKFSGMEKPAMATKDAGTFTIPQQRAMREAEARDARIEAARAAAMAGGGLPQNQYEMMAQLYRANTPASPAHAVMGNTINSYLNYGRNLDSIYNSPTGPYGQMQAAATAQRPYKAEERVAKINTEAAKDIARQKLQGVRQMARLFERRRDPLALAELDGDFGAAGPVARPSFYVR